MDGSIVVADTAHAQILRTASASAEAVHALAVVNQYLAAGVADGSVRVYHFETLEIVRTLRPKRTVASVGAYAAHAVLSVAFSPDGQHLAASCVDSAVRVFGWASEQSIRSFESCSSAAAPFDGCATLQSADGSFSVYLPQREVTVAVEPTDHLFMGIDGVLYLLDELGTSVRVVNIAWLSFGLFRNGAPLQLRELTRLIDALPLEQKVTVAALLGLEAPLRAACSGDERLCDCTATVTLPTAGRLPAPTCVLPSPLHYSLLLRHDRCSALLVECGADFAKPLDLTNGGGSRWQMHELGFSASAMVLGNVAHSESFASALLRLVQREARYGSQTELQIAECELHRCRAERIGLAESVPFPPPHDEQGIVDALAIMPAKVFTQDDEAKLDAAIAASDRALMPPLDEDGNETAGAVVPQYSHAIKAQLRRALAAISAVHLRESVAAVAEGITRVTAVLSQERAAAALCFGVSIRPQAHILASNAQHGRTHVHPHASLRRHD